MIGKKGRVASLVAVLGAGLAALCASAASATNFSVTNLVSDGSVAAAHTDSSLINPWGVSYSPTGPFWVSDNNWAVTTVYDGTGTKQLQVNIPPPTGKAGGGAPTGQVYNGRGADFLVTKSGHSGSALFIFATEDGTISGWAPSVDSANAILAVDNSKNGTGAVYKGLAIVTGRTTQLIYATNFRAGDVEIYNTKFHLIKTFTDAMVPKGYAPFNVQAVGRLLYVSFAKQNATKHDSVAGAGFGYVDVFTASGVLVRRIASGGVLNAPWGLDIAPAGFGPFGGDLLVGNFGNGRINVFDPVKGTFKGQLQGVSGKPLVFGDLWALINGNGGQGGDPKKVYFTAGLQAESHGLFGSLSPAP